MSEYHKSVLLDETITLLNIKPGMHFIDATLGGGGHTEEIIRQGGIVLGIDVDDDALQFVRNKFATYIDQGKLIVVKENFRNIDMCAKEHAFEHIDGIIFDLGVSSYQFDTKERGFSFREDTRLDMRMDRKLSVTAADLVNVLTKGELYELFTNLGEEHFAWKISNNIVSARKNKPIETTSELARIAEISYPRGFKKIHPATKIFQALRIAVNDEIHNLKDTLPKSIDILASKGRLAVISFHSLEDRIVKNYYKVAEEEIRGSIVTKKPIEAGVEEINSNARARSAKLRIFEKI